MKEGNPEWRCQFTAEEKAIILRQHLPKMESGGLAGLETEISKGVQAEAIQLVTQRGVTLTQASRDLGLIRSCFGNGYVNWGQTPLRGAAEARASTSIRPA